MQFIHQGINPAKMELIRHQTKGIRPQRQAQAVGTSVSTSGGGGGKGWGWDLFALLKPEQSGAVVVT